MKLIGLLKVKGDELFITREDRFKLPRTKEDLVLFLKDQGIKDLHIVDVDALHFKKPLNLKFCLWLKEKDFSVTYNGGLSNKYLIKEALSQPIDKLVLPTAVALTPFLLSELKEYKDKLLVYIESFNNIVVIRGWSEVIEYNAADLANQFKREGIETVILHEQKPKDIFGGLNIEVIKKFIDTTDVKLQIKGPIIETTELSQLIDKLESRLDGIILEELWWWGKINPKVFIEVIQKAKEVLEVKNIYTPVKEKKKEKTFEDLLTTIAIQKQYQYQLYKDKLEEIKNLVEKNNKILIEGEYGIGKTGILANLYPLFIKKYNVFYYPFKQEQSAEVFLSYLAKEFRILEEVNKIVNIFERIDFILKKITEGYLLILDDLQLVKDYFLKQALTKLTKLKIPLIMTTSHYLDFSLNIDKKIKLEGLNMDEAIGYLRSLQLEEKDQVLRDIYTRIGGNPLALFYFATLVRRFWYEPVGLLQKLPSDFSQLNEFLLDRIFNDLSQDMKDFLALFCFFRQPVDIFFLKPLYESVGFEETFEELKQTVGVVTTIDGKFELPLAFKRFLLPKIKEKRLYFKKIANIYSNILKDTTDLKIESYIEYFYHTFNAGLYSEALGILLEVADNLLDVGWCNELLIYLSKFDPSILTVSEWLWVLFYKGRIYMKKGELKSAQEAFLETLEASEKLKINDVKLFALYWYGILLEESSQKQRALTNYKLALRLEDELIDQKSQEIIKKIKERLEYLNA